MYKYIVLYLCVSSSGVLCEYLNKLEGDECEWEGLSGKCVEETRCLTTLDGDSPKHPVCTKKLGNKIICCTDCSLVNNTKNAILTPEGLSWKDGQKARDYCLQYLQDLPYKCKGDGFYAGITRDLDEDNKCYEYSVFDTDSSSDATEPRVEYPHSAFLGVGEDLESASWLAGGAIISDKYILTSASSRDLCEKTCERSPPILLFIALGVKKFSDDPTAWQTHTMKRYIEHPDYKLYIDYNDIALIETENRITFNKNVLPACLHVEAADDETAVATTWKSLVSASHFDFADTIQTINLDKYSDEECNTTITNISEYQNRSSLKDGIKSATQMCYGSKSGDRGACKGLGGEPLLISTQFSSCIYTIIGVTSFYYDCYADVPPTIYTRVAPYIPWIESVVWP